MNGRSSATALILVAITAVTFAACRGEQELRDDCPSAGNACPACTADADCTIVSNTCLEAATCTSRKREPALAVVQIGCNWEYDAPPAERCGCVAGVCRAR
jgi:hypothetical protein